MKDLSKTLDRSFSRRDVLKVAAGSAASWALAACLPASNSQAPGSPGSGASPVGGSSGPKAKPDITIIDGRPVTSLDQNKSGNLIQINNMGDHLTRIERGQGPEVGPWLADIEQVSPTQLRLKLQAAKFHNGATFDAEAAKWNIENYRKNGLNWEAWDAVDHAEVVDSSTVDVILSYPTGILPLVWAATGVMIDPAWAQGPDFTPDNLVGTGPGMMSDWAKGDHLTLAANPDYWGGELTWNTVTYRAIPNPSNRANAAIAKEADIVVGILPADVERVKATAGMRVVVVEGMRTQHIRLRDDVGPLQDPVVRQALNYGVNIQEIIDGVFQGYGKPLQGQAQPEGAKYWQKDVQGYGYDPDRAKSLLAQAGYPNGFKTELGTGRGEDPGDYEFSQAIAGQLAKIGVEVEVIVHEAGENTAGTLGEVEVEPLYYWGLGNFIPDPENTFRDLAVSREGGGYVHAQELQDIYGQMKLAATEEDRNRVAFEGISFLRDYAPFIFGIQLAQVYAISDRIDWEPRPYSFADYLSEIKVK